MQVFSARQEPRPPVGACEKSHFGSHPYRYLLQRQLSIYSTMRALTPARHHFARQVSPLSSIHLPDIPSPTTKCVLSSFYQPFPTQEVIFRLRHAIGGSPLHPAESGSLSYGLPVRFRLLPTPPHGDAVTFCFGAMAYSGRGLSPR